MFGWFSKNKNKNLDPLDFSVLSTDIHSHLIPGIDDGSPDIDTTILIIKELQSLGYKKIITSPHVMSDFYKNSSEVILTGLADVRATLKLQKINIEIDAVSSATPPYVEMSFGMGVENYPAICMTQHAAIKFCEWLSALTGKFYRLPTEAEWEYACRAGTSSSYSFGDNIEDLYEYGWFKSNSNDSYNKVKQKKPNPWGLYDMHGNVSEWTLDQYIPTIYRTRKNISVDPFEIPNKVYPKTVRGGSWMDNPSRLRSASRRPSSKKWKKRDPQIPKSIWWHTDAPFVGIRVVRPLNTPNIEEQKKYWNNYKTK